MLVKDKEIEKITEKSYSESADKLCYMFLIFIVGCFVGWLYEEAFYTLTEGMLRNRGILYGPWLPIYGMGALGIYAMKPLKRNPVLLFLLCIVITGVVEYIIGFAGIRLFNMRLWDYRGLFLNINGIICFRSVVSFGFLGMFFHYVLEPFSEKAFMKTDKTVIRAACIAILLLFTADCVISAFFRTPITY